MGLLIGKHCMQLPNSAREVQYWAESPGPSAPPPPHDDELFAKARTAMLDEDLERERTQMKNVKKLLLLGNFSKTMEIARNALLQAERNRGKPHFSNRCVSCT